MGVEALRFARSDGQGVDFLTLRACTGMRARLRFFYKVNKSASLFSSFSVCMDNCTLLQLSRRGLDARMQEECRRNSSRRSAGEVQEECRSSGGGMQEDCRKSAGGVQEERTGVSGCGRSARCTERCAGAWIFLPWGLHGSERIGARFRSKILYFTRGNYGSFLIWVFLEMFSYSGVCRGVSALERAFNQKFFILQGEIIALF